MVQLGTYLSTWQILNTEHKIYLFVHTDFGRIYHQGRNLQTYSLRRLQATANKCALQGVSSWNSCKKRHKGNHYVSHLTNGTLTFLIPEKVLYLLLICLIVLHIYLIELLPAIGNPMIRHFKPAFRTHTIPRPYRDHLYFI